MEKRLRAGGNSLALTIDKPILRILGIGPNTPVRISIVDRKLIVEPMMLDPCEAVTKEKYPDAMVDVVDTIDAASLVRTLMQRFGMGPETFGQLHRGGDTHNGVIKFEIAAKRPSRMTPAEQATLRRLWECFRILRERGMRVRGADWERAIATALERVPFEDEVASAACEPSTRS